MEKLVCTAPSGRLDLTLTPHRGVNYRTKPSFQDLEGSGKTYKFTVVSGERVRFDFKRFSDPELGRTTEIPLEGVLALFGRLRASSTPRMTFVDTKENRGEKGLIPGIRQDRRGVWLSAWRLDQIRKLNEQCPEMVRFAFLAD